MRYLKWFIGWVAIVLIVMPLVGHSVPRQNPQNGHFYELVVSGHLDWHAAKTAAEGMFFQGIQGHLVTILSADEQTFIDDILRGYPQTFFVLLQRDHAAASRS